MPDATEPPDALHLIIAALAQTIVDADGRMVPDAERLARSLLVRECQLYRAAGAPYGDTIAGLLVWLDSASRLTPSA